MKKLVSAIALSLISTGAFAIDGTVNFSGNISGTTCAISNLTAGVLDVTMPTVSKTALSSANSVAGLKPFTLQLACPTTSTGSVKAYWEPTSTNVTSSGYLKNTASTGAASNVAIQLIDSNTGIDAPINLFNDTLNNVVPIAADGSATLNYKAQYIALTNAVAPGLVKASVQFSLVYS
ncbi:MAG: Major fimbrial subunit SMF-1 [Legionellaceae bacterium]